MKKTETVGIARSAEGDARTKIKTNGMKKRLDEKATVSIRNQAAQNSIIDKLISKSIQISEEGSQENED